MTHPIKPQLSVIDGNATATSLTLAEHFGMRHKNVLQAIDNATRGNPEEFGLLNFQPAEYLDAQGKPRLMYRLTKAALCFVVLGLTGSEAGHWKAAYIEAFDAMAGTLRRHDGDTERRLREVVEFGKQFCLSSQRAEEVLLMLLSEAPAVVEALAARTRYISGAEELGLALLLTGLRVPDAALYVLLARRSNPVADQPAQWVQLSYKALARELGGTTAPRVRAALDRLCTLGLVKPRVVPGSGPGREYRADIAWAQALLERLKADPGRQLAVRTVLSRSHFSPLAGLIVPSRPQQPGATSRDACAFINRWIGVRGQLAQRLMDSPLTRVDEYLQALLEPEERQEVGQIDAAQDDDGLAAADLPALERTAATVDEQGRPRLLMIDGRPMTTSLALARHFDKRHDNVLRDIRRAAGDAPKRFARLNFLPATYVNEQGKKQPMYYLPANGFWFVAMGFTGAEAGRWKIAYIRAFDQMQAELLRRQQHADEQMREAVDLVRLVAECRQREDEVAHRVMSHSSRFAQALAPSDEVMGAEELGLALLLAGQRVPDAAVYVELVRQCNPRHYLRGAPQWLAKSSRALSADLDGSTPGRVRASLARLVALGLLECRKAPGRRPLEYLADPRQGLVRLEQLRAEAAEHPVLRTVLAAATASPLARVIEAACPTGAPSAAAAAEARSTAAYWRSLHEEVSARSDDLVWAFIAEQLQLRAEPDAVPPACCPAALPCVAGALHA